MLKDLYKRLFRTNYWICRYFCKHVKYSRFDTDYIIPDYTAPNGILVCGKDCTKDEAYINARTELVKRDLFDDDIIYNVRRPNFIESWFYGHLFLH